MLQPAPSTIREVWLASPSYGLGLLGTNSGCLSTRHLILLSSSGKQNLRYKFRKHGTSFLYDPFGNIVMYFPFFCSHLWKVQLISDKIWAEQYTPDHLKIQLGVGVERPVRKCFQVTKETKIVLFESFSLYAHNYMYPSQHLLFSFQLSLHKTL